MNLKTRLSLIFIAYTGGVLALFGGTYFIVERRAATRAQQEDQLKSLEKMVSVCREMHMTSNPFIVVAYLKAVKREPNVVSAACLNAQGLIRAHSDSRMIGQTIQAADDLKSWSADTSPRHRLADGGSTLEWRAPVVVEGSLVGQARIGYDAQALNREIHLKLWNTLRQPMIVGGFTFMLATLVALALAWSLARPIRRLADAARAIGEGRWNESVSSDNRKDELGFLAREMDSMAGKLKVLDDLKDDFISGVSHDLRSPMAAIGMYVDYILNVDPDQDKILPKHKKILVTIKENAVRLSVFVTNILDHAKMKAGRMEYAMTSVDVEPIARNIQALYGIVAFQQGIDLRIQIPSGLPPIHADPERFEQILSNLVSNALKFTLAGGSISLAARGVANAVEVIVADTGQGIPKEDLPKVFEKFSQFDLAAQRARGIRGSGLGLTIVKQTVEAMAGTLNIESERGKGTQVTISLPVAVQVRRPPAPPGDHDARP